MRHITPIIIAVSALLLAACSPTPQPAAEPKSKAEKAEPDSMVYGLTCDGTSDSVLMLLPLDRPGADPVAFNTETAKAQGRIIGRPEIGDWVGVLLNPEDSTEATLVVDLDQLKGTWTRQVRPTWKTAARMSRRAQRRRMAELPDSLREAYMVPREYGFTLKRSAQASPVGYVMTQSSLADDSPVEYPPVENVTGWNPHNGRLVLIITPRQPIGQTPRKAPRGRERRDTLDFVLMTADSLVLTNARGERQAYHRKADAMSANAAASAAAEKTQQRKAGVLAK